MRGADKLIEPVAGIPLLRRAALAGLAAGLPVTVVLPPDRPARAAAVADLPVACTVARHAAAGMGHSLAAGIAAVPGRAAIIHLADLPDIGAEDLAALRDAARANPGRILRATAADGTPGHPVVFPLRLRPTLLRLTGDEGARAVLRGEAPLPVPLPGRRAVTDLDTPEDWARWRAGGAVD